VTLCAYVNYSTVLIYTKNVIVRKVLFGTRMQFSPFVEVNHFQYNPDRPLTPGSIVEFGDGPELEWAIVDRDEIIRWKSGRVFRLKMSHISAKCRYVYYRCKMWGHILTPIFHKQTKNVYIQDRAECLRDENRK